MSRGLTWFLVLSVLFVMVTCCGLSCLGLIGMTVEPLEAEGPGSASDPAVPSGGLGVLKVGGDGFIDLELPISSAERARDGFIDLDLPISSAERARDGTVSVTALADHEGTTVGLTVELDPLRQAKGVALGGLTVHFGTGRVLRPGDEGDAFVRSLASLYDLPCDGPAMTDKVEAKLVILEGTPEKALEEPVKVKYTFSVEAQGDTDEDDSAEVFINLDVPNKRLEFHEKDPDYREPLLQALCGG